MLPTSLLGSNHPQQISKRGARDPFGPIFGYPAWMDQGLCSQTDPEAFFPEKGGSTRQAKAVCAACPVRVKCLDYALDRDERVGVWGGLSERERQRLKKAAS